MKRKLWLMILAALGFQTACDSEKEDDPIRVMYGTPYVNYEIEGLVTDKDGTPIAGIVVSDGESGVPSSASVYTDGDGRYVMTHSAVFRTATLHFNDIDDEANGGIFKYDKMVVEFTEDDRISEGTNSWNEGTFRRENVDITLTRLVEEE